MQHYNDQFEISIISPVYHGEKTVEELCRQIIKAVEPLHVHFEIILVEDGSPDRSWEAIEKACQTDQRIIGIKLTRNFGQHAAMTAGLEAARGNYVAILDCDLQDDPKYIVDLYHTAKKGFDVVYTEMNKRHHSIFRNIFARMYYSIIQWLTGNEISINIDLSGYLLITRKVVLAFKQIREKHRHYVMILNQNIEKGDVYIIKSQFNKKYLYKIRHYIENIGRHSLPNYHPIEEGCPNFHRMNRFDPPAYVKGCFHQFSFFPWNQDIFNLFEQFKSIYYLKNKLSQLRNDQFLSMNPEHGCIARLSFQFYPKGLGMLNAHADPLDRHQLTVPVMLLSKKGEDFKEGGAFVERSDGTRIILDDVGDWGDVIYFNAQVVHGVETIDPNEPCDWLSFQGRWMLLFAVNKLSQVTDISNSIDYSNE